MYIRGGHRACEPEDFHVPHVLEHAVYNGSKQYPTADALLEYLENNGTFTNAMTGNYFNKYEFLTSRDEVQSIIPVAIDMIFRPLLTQASLRQEKEIIRNEIGEKLHAIEQEVANLETSLMLPDLAPSFEQQLVDLENVTLEKVKALHKRHHTTRNAAVIVAGNLSAADQKACLASLEKSMRGIPAGEKLPMQTKELVEPDEDEYTIYPLPLADDNACLVRFSFFKAMEMDDRLLARVKMFESIACGGLGGSLTKFFREEGYVYGIQTESGGSLELTSLSFYAQVPRAKTGKFVYAFKRAVYALLQTIDDKNLGRAKKLALGTLARGHESPGELVEWYEMDLLLDRPLTDPQAYSKIISKLTPADITSLRDDFFDFETMNVIYATLKPEELATMVAVALAAAGQDNHNPLETNDQKSILGRAEQLQYNMDLVHKYEKSRFLTALKFYTIVMIPLLLFVAIGIFLDSTSDGLVILNTICSLPMLAGMAYFFYEARWKFEVPFPRVVWSVYALFIIAFDVYLNIFRDTFNWDSLFGLVLLLPAYLMVLWLGFKGPVYPPRYWVANDRIVGYLETPEKH